MPFSFLPDSAPWISARRIGIQLRRVEYGGGSWRDQFVSLFARRRELRFSNKSAATLEDVTFDVHPGERVALLGPNGAGKTTLCRCLAGIFAVHSGQVETRGTHRAVFGSGLGGVSQELSGRDGLHLLHRIIFPESRERELHLQSVVDFSGLGPAIDRPLRHYSYGMLNRLWLSLVTEERADLWILDEISGGEDQGFRERLQERLESRIGPTGSALQVTHSVREVERFATRVLILEEGKLIFDGPRDAGIEAYLQTTGSSAQRS